ncbi:MAG: NAD(P)-dependent oxidoreductase [Candidatus Margulisiibacteriota bacterium]|jgi:nucleoside-diphosphate-sugar epimerase
MKKIFITGLSGCVGHYLFDELIGDPNLELYCLIRTPQKLRFDPQAYPRLKIIIDDMNNIAGQAELLKEMDAVVHLAADWGGNEGNYDYSLTLFELLDPTKCQKVIYFSTASILGSDNQPIVEAEKYGTHYIRSKYRLFKKLPDLKIYPNIVTLFPTWVLGGDQRHPFSHASAGMLSLKNWLWLIRFFTVDASFHFIHARDIARITSFLLRNPAEKTYVLGNPPITASRLIGEICSFFGYRTYFQLPLPLFLVKILARISEKKLHSWDEFCLQKRHFIHQTVNASSFNFSSELSTITGILRDQTQ